MSNVKLCGVDFVDGVASPERRVVQHLCGFEGDSELKRSLLLRSTAPSFVYFEQAFGRRGPNPLQGQGFNHAIHAA